MIRKFRIEGHTDSGAVDPNGRWPSNWELASSRSNNVLKLFSRIWSNRKSI